MTEPKVKGNIGHSDVKGSKEDVKVSIQITGLGDYDHAGEVLEQTKEFLTKLFGQETL